MINQPKSSPAQTGGLSSLQSTGAVVGSIQKLPFTLVSKGLEPAGQLVKFFVRVHFRYVSVYGICKFSLLAYSIAIHVPAIK